MKKITSLLFVSLFFVVFAAPAFAIRVVINPGHSVGCESGAVSPYIPQTESEVNQILSDCLLVELVNRGYDAYITHTTDTTIDRRLMDQHTAAVLRNIPPIANSISPDLAISIHHNSGSADKRGTELYWSSYRSYDPAGVYEVPGLWSSGSVAFRDSSPCQQAQDSRRFAHIVAGHFGNFPNLPFRSIVERDDHLPAHMACPCILYEGGYLSNPQEAPYLMTGEYLGEAVKRLADSVDEYFGIDRTPKPFRLSVASGRTTMVPGEAELISPQGANPGPFSFSSDNPGVIQMDPAGGAHAAGTGTATVTAVSADGISASVSLAVCDPGQIMAAYCCHVQNIGWMDVVGAGLTGGTTGRALQMEALRVCAAYPDGRQVPAEELGINAAVHVENIGWMNPVGPGAMAGTEGMGLQMEAVNLTLSGRRAGEFVLRYRTHVENIGWTGWAEAGQNSGSAGKGYRIEAVEILLLPEESASSLPAGQGLAFYQ